jgi:hypothetical protein
MYVVVSHTIKNPEVASSRGARLISGEGAPEGVRVLQFYMATDGSRAACLWEATSTDAVQEYVDTTLGDSSSNEVYEIDAGQSFSERPLGLAASAPVNQA